jgi:hypothetical protein
MDRKTFSIGILSLTALILAVACLFPAKPAQADFAVKDVSRLQLVTVTSQQGGNVLYLIDPVGGKIVMLAFDANGTHDLRPVASTTLDKVFP